MFQLKGEGQRSGDGINALMSIYEFDGHEGLLTLLILLEKRPSTLAWFKQVRFISDGNL